MPVLYKLFISHINRPRGIQLETFSLWIWMFPHIFPLAKWRGDILFVWLAEDNSFIFYEYKTWLLCWHKSNYAFKAWTFTRNILWENESNVSKHLSLFSSWSDGGIGYYDHLSPEFTANLEHNLNGNNHCLHLKPFKKSRMIHRNSSKAELAQLAAAVGGVSGVHCCRPECLWYYQCSSCPKDLKKHLALALLNVTHVHGNDTDDVHLCLRSLKLELQLKDCISGFASFPMTSNLCYALENGWQNAECRQLIVNRQQFGKSPVWCLIQS